MKRANKTGSIVKRNDKKRRRPYSVYMDGGMDPDTFKRKRIFLGSFAKHSEAQDFLEKYRQMSSLKEILASFQIRSRYRLKK